MEFLSTQLANGLQIVAECNDEAYSTALGFFVRTGARDETDAIAGVSHFLEHMMFKGTPSRTAADVNREFDAMGAHYNACTGEEATIYYAAVLPEYQERAVDLLSDILRPLLKPADFQTEKQVILEEIRMYEDQPPFGADEKVRSAHYGSHPLGRSVLGSIESVAALPVEAMREYFQRRYSPGNIVLAAAGRVDFAALVRSVEQRCGAWEPLPAPRDVQPAQPHPGFQCLQRENAAQQYLLELVPGPAAEDSDRYAAKILAMILGDDSGSRLYWELVDSGLAEQASLGHYEYEGAGSFLTYMSCDPEYAAESLQRIHAVYRQAQNEGFSAEELTQAKNKVLSRIVLTSERPRGRLFTVGGDWIQRHEYRSVSADLHAIAALAIEEITAVLAKYPLTNSTAITIGPLAEEAFV